MSDRAPGGRRRTRLALGVVAISVVSAGVGIFVGSQLKSPADAAAEAAPPAPSRITVPVEQRSLVARLVANGELQYSEPTYLRLAGSVGASGGATQIVTKAPALDQPVADGDVVMEVSGRPVFLFQGDLPTYRPLEPGSKGPDVLQLETALARLGTFGGTPDDVYDDNTEAAIDYYYALKGYKSEGPSDEQRTRLRAAEKAVTEADKGVVAAQQALAEGGKGLTGAQLLQAQQQLQAARDAVPAAQQSADRRNADAVAAVVTATAVRDAATTARNTARAARNAAVVADAINPDTGVPYTASEIAALNETLAAKEVALLEAEGALRTAVSARDQTAADTAKEVASAQGALALAELTYTESIAPKDTRTLNDAVKTARQALDQANADLLTVQAEVGTKMPAGEMIFLPSLPTTITEVAAEAGKAPADPFATVSSTSTRILGRISSADADLVQLPAPVTVELRDVGISTTGVLTEIKKQTEGGDGGGGGGDGSGGGDGAGRLVIVVEPDDPKLLNDYIGFPARITISVSSTEGEVLAVPVAAISVGADGESRVEVERSEGDGPDAVEIVKVTVGLTAEGYAEITPVEAGALQRGDRVVVGEDRRRRSGQADTSDGGGDGG